MFISKNWLEDFVTIPKELKAKELAERLTLSSFEVEGAEDQKKALNGIVVGEVLNVSKHKGADKLKVAEVTIGSKTLHIVCGAPNLKKRQKVAVALVGTTLPNGMTMEERKIRGELSQGMICGADEIGLGGESDEIMVLDEKATVGKPLASALGYDDTIIEVDNKSITHRPDLWGHYGIAREVAAILKLKLKDYPQTTLKTGSEKLSIQVKEKKRCPRYMATKVEGITVEESPGWMQKRLIAAGLRPINSIVDITNYVMLESGQPMHAFDSKKVNGNITVRNAERGEKFSGLDDEKYTLEPKMLVIADEKGLIALAGVIGGKGSAVSDKTTSIILESANFEHVSIRSTSQKLGLRTDSSIRFEKSLDHGLTALAMNRALKLILDLNTDTRIVSAITDVKHVSDVKKTVETSVGYINERMGATLSSKEISTILNRLGFGVKGTEKLTVTIPSWRATKDISIAEDIVEEVARIYGYENIPMELPHVHIQRQPFDAERVLQRKMRTILAYGFDMSEVYNYSFTTQKQLRDFDLSSKDHVRIGNPQNKDLAYLRRSLVPGIVDAVKANVRNFDNFNLFEVGKVFHPEKKGVEADAKGKEYLPLQNICVACAVVEKGNDEPFYVIKNYVEQTLKQLRINYEFKEVRNVPEWSSSSRNIGVFVDGKEIGVVGELALRYYNDFKIKPRVALFELNVTELSKFYSNELRYTSIPKYPSIERDVSVILDKNILWKNVRDIVSGLNKDVTDAISLIDVYEGKGMEENQKSLTFRVTYRSADRTLESKEVDRLHEKVLSALKKELGGNIRG